MKNKDLKSDLQKALEIVSVFVEMKINNEENQPSEKLVINYENELKTTRKSNRASMLSDMDKKLYQETRKSESKQYSNTNLKTE